MLRAIPLAFAACGDRDLEKFSPQVVERLTAGDSLSAALQECRSFSRILVGCLQAGETVGHVEKVLHWVSEFNEQELDYALTTWMDLVEPLLVLVMGGIVGLMMLATMLPMVKVLQTL